MRMVLKAQNWEHLNQLIHLELAKISFIDLYKLLSIMIWRYIIQTKNRGTFLNNPYIMKSRMLLYFNWWEVSYLFT